MGGLAAHVESRWPALAVDYRTACRTGTFTLGDALPWLDEASGVWIYNLATQQHPGADARLRRDRGFCAGGGTRTPEPTTCPGSTCPRIGADIGGLQWEDVESTLEAVAAAHPNVDLVVVTKR